MEVQDVVIGTYKYLLPEVQPKWWHSAVIYQIYPRSFQDSNGDGVGDIRGIISRLGYLKDIGVTGVWLSPIYPSPQADFGYDISDFKNVDPEYGTMADMEEMIRKAHELGLKVIFDIVPNHTSDEHEWFRKSAACDPKYKDYYVWHEGKMDDVDENGRPAPPNNWLSNFRFSAWTWNERRQAYYLHQFASKQPDLNYRNPDVVEEMKDVFRFWMTKGVDGFRVDAVPFLFEDEDLRDEPVSAEARQGGGARGAGIDKDDYGYLEHVFTMDHPDTYRMVREWRQLVDSHSPSRGSEADSTRLIMTEVYSTFDNTILYYGSKDRPGGHFTFNFEIVSRLTAASDAAAFKRVIDRWLQAMEDWRWPNWVVGNHDNKRVATRFPNMVDAINMVVLSLPGTAITYNGEEIGMTDAFITWEQTRDPLALNKGPEGYLQVSRDPCRTPFQWDDSTSAGFSTNARTWMPVNPNYWDVNVQNEENRSNSHLKVYKCLTDARRTATMQVGSTETSVVGNNILKIVRSLKGNPTFVTLVNLASWEDLLQPSDVGEDVFTVFASSVGSKYQSGDTVKGPLTMRPKEALLLSSSTAP